MTKPIAQTFYINEPIGGVEGVILTRLDVYFASVSSTYGVEIQIRQTDNGNPTPNILPRASKTIQVGDTYASDTTYVDSKGNTQTLAAGTTILQSSADASVPVVFEFDTPISLQTQTTYAFVIIPVGGNPDYTVWTSELGGTDVTTNSPVYTNNDTGTLFLSSNDVQFTAIQTEDIKFTAYIANFTASSGTAAYDLFAEERIQYTSLVGSFVPNETVLVSNAAFNLAALTINANTGAFTVGETVYQSNGSANNATGIVFSANNSKILITNSNGSWVTSPGSNTYQVVGNTSSAYANTSAVSQNVVVSSNTTILVPFTGNNTANIFYANQSLYIGTNNRSSVDAKIVNAVVNSTAITINYNSSFTDNNAILGQIRGDGLSLYGQYSGPQSNDPILRFNVSTYVGWLYNSTANATVNFTNTSGQYLIGFTSKSSALSQGIKDLPYHAVIPDFTQVESKSTAIDWTFIGIDNANTYDSTGIPVTNGTEKELLDKPRLIKSRSHEIRDNGANNTTLMTATFTTANSKFSPFIDGMMNNVRFTRNNLPGANQTYGYFISTSNTNGAFREGLILGDQVSQSNGTVIVTGQVYIVNPTSIYICNTSGPFTSGYSIYKTSNTSTNTYAVSVIEYNEKYSSNVFPIISRYMSKSVVLAENQDAEDLHLYLTAYRPANTNFQIYGKFLHNQDPDTFSSKIWSRLSESNTTKALISSGVNKDDFVELQYVLPTSTLLTQNTTTCSSTSNTITLGALGSTASISNGSFIYLYNSSSNNFIVRQVGTVSNNTTFTITSNASFSSTNADIGIIAGLEHPTGAFLYANNNNIVRYVSAADVVYDSYKTFAIKIVPTSENSAVAPRAGDYRALALQV